MKWWPTGDQTLERSERVRMTASMVFCWFEGRGWWQPRMLYSASPQTNKDSGLTGRLSNRSGLEGRGGSGRAHIEQLVKRVGRHADGCFPHAAVAASNAQSHLPQPARNHRWPPLRSGRRYHGGTTMEAGLDAVPPTEGTLYAE